ncbi:hypothetical protein ACF09Y_24775 [Streptomyces massasporeus]|uniref:hypothetical protein n=1 Tax=Streptomyces massasporeus TaxID=67324 RepID=UPI0036FFC227
MLGTLGAGASVAQIPPQAYLDLRAHLTEQGIAVWISGEFAVCLDQIFTCIYQTGDRH